jgi:hypothetical protein
MIIISDLVEIDVQLTELNYVLGAIRDISKDEYQDSYKEPFTQFLNSISTQISDGKHLILTITHDKNSNVLCYDFTVDLFTGKTNNEA